MKTSSRINLRETVRIITRSNLESTGGMNTSSQKPERTVELQLTVWYLNELDQVHRIMKPTDELNNKRIVLCSNKWHAGAAEGRRVRREHASNLQRGLSSGFNL